MHQAYMVCIWYIKNMELMFEEEKNNVFYL